MKKIKLDSYDLGIIINGIYSYKQTCSSDKGKQIDYLLLWLIDIYEGMKPGRKKRIEFHIDQIRLVVFCLNEWRNSFLSGSSTNKAEAIAETMAKFIG